MVACRRDARPDLVDFRLLKEAMRHCEGGGAMDGEMGLTPEELARLTPDELAELRQVYAEGHAAGYAVGYAESYVKGVRDALADRGLNTEREVPPDNGEE
jgi:hypothetical protein